MQINSSSIRLPSPPSHRRGQVVDTLSHRVVRTIGSDDAGQNRFLSVAVCGDDPKVDKQMELARNNSKSNKVSYEVAF